MLRRTALLLVIASIVLATGVSGAIAEPLPFGWWHSSDWTRIEVPHTPAGYVRLYEPRSEVIGDLGAPYHTTFLCLHPCNRLLAAQLDSWWFPRTETLWWALFSRRPNPAHPRVAVAILASGSGWSYRGLYGSHRTARAWLQHALPCRRHSVQLPGRGKVTRWINCARRIRQRLGRREYELTARVTAGAHEISDISLEDERAVKRRVDQSNKNEGFAISFAARRAADSQAAQSKGILDASITSRR